MDPWEIPLPPFTHEPSPPSSATPFPPLPQRSLRRRLLQDAAIAQSTAVLYEQAYQDWAEFTFVYNFPPFPSPDSLSLFVVYRARSVVPSILADELSALAFWFRPIDGPRWDNVRSSWEVVMALDGNSNLDPLDPEEALPVPIKDLERAIRASVADGYYDGLLWAAMATVAFLACATIEELTSDVQHPLYRDSRKHIARAAVHLSRSGFSANLPYDSAHPLYRGSMLRFSSTDAGDLLKVVRAYVSARDTRHGKAGALWIDGRGVVPTRRWFMERVEALCGTKYTEESLRAGGALWYTGRNLDEEAIRRLGRWKSEEWDEYVVLQVDIVMALRNREASNVPPVPVPPPSFPRSTLAALAPFL
ncbi:hypothetical protein JCM1840_004817 [Sporobolomyces johnsonii]